MERPREIARPDGRRIKILYPRVTTGKRAVLSAARRYARRGAARHAAAGQATRILIQTTGGIGNTLMATPLFAETRRLFPNAVIDVYTTPGGAQILEDNPHINSVLTDRENTDGPRRGLARLTFAAFARSILDIRRGAYDVALLAHNSIELKGALRPLLARIPVRVIHRYPFDPEDDIAELFTHVVPYERKHDCEGNLDLLRALVSKEVVDVPMVLPVTRPSELAAEQSLRSAGFDVAAPIVGICPGCRQWARDKRWPCEKYAALTNAVLSNDKDVQIAAFCGPHDVNEATALRGLVQNRRFRVVENLSLSRYAAALKRCRIVVSNDTLPMHMCSALAVPVVAIFGPTDPVRVGPWKCTSKVVSPPAEWSPYFAMPYFCDLGAGMSCIEKISVDDVIAAMVELQRENLN